VALITSKVKRFVSSSAHITNLHVDETLKEALSLSLNVSLRSVLMSELATLEEQLIDEEEDTRKIDARSKDIVDIYEDGSRTPAVQDVDILEQIVSLIRAIGLEVPATDAVALQKQRMICDILDQVNAMDDAILTNVVSLLFAQQTGIEGGLIKLERYILTFDQCMFF